MLWSELAVDSVPISSRLNAFKGFIFPSEQCGILGCCGAGAVAAAIALLATGWRASIRDHTPSIYKCQDESIDYRRNCPITFEGSTGMRRSAAACCRQGSSYSGAGKSLLPTDRHRWDLSRGR